MRIARFRIENYKSFRTTEDVSLTLGFNVIVGENNVGKTALIESLSLRVGGNPHWSLETAPTRDAPLLGLSSITVTFDLPGSELLPFLRRMGGFYFPTLHNDASNAARDLTGMLGSPSLELETTWHNGGLIKAGFSGLPTPPPLFAVLRVAPSGTIDS